MANDATKISDDYTTGCLSAIVTALRQTVVPALTTPEAKANADHITRLLYMLQSRFSRRGSDLQQLIADEKAIGAQIEKLLPQPKKGDSPLASGDDFSAIETLERNLYAEETGLAENLPQLLQLARSDSPQKQSAVTLLRKLVSVQKQFLAKQDPDILKGSYVCYQGGRIDEERPVERHPLLGEEITEDSLTRRLQSSFPGARVTELSIMVGGMSKTTIFFTLVKASGEKAAMVIRKDLPIELTSTVGYEFPLVQHLYKAGFPVAEPIWLEHDPVPFGGRFMISRRVRGSTDFKRWAGDQKKTEEFARRLAKLMVELHSLKPDRLGYSKDVAGKSAGDMMRVEVDRWYRIFREQRKEVYPLEEMAMAWVKDNIPHTLFSRPASLVHGDIGFHNLMIDEGKVTALLDWELSHLGDPIEDLVYTKPFIEKVMDWSVFKSYYREYGGVACTDEEEHFYTVWSKTRNPLTCVQAVRIFTELPYDIKLATSGFILGRYLELEAAEMIVDALEA